MKKTTQTPAAGPFPEPGERCGVAESGEAPAAAPPPGAHGVPRGGGPQAWGWGSTGINGPRRAEVGLKERDIGRK